MSEEQRQRWHVDPVAAVQHACGSLLPVHVATRIAEAVLATCDNILTLDETVYAEFWDDDERFRGHVRKKMRYALLDHVTSLGLVPTTLPTEEIRREQVGPFGPADTGSATNVIVRLSVPVRTPSIDRAKAVRAGIL